MMNKILVVDDEQDLCEILRFNLESEGYEVDTANSAEEGLGILSANHCLILLDVMMEDMSGFQMANKIRKELHSEVPIIFLTAKDTENDMLTGFNVGADDYITKPFSSGELLARVRAALRNNRFSADEGRLPGGRFTLKDLEIGGSAIIQSVGGEGALRQHFLDMGVIPGAEVTVEKTLKKVYKILDNVTPLREDCGKLCSGECCKGDDDTGMLLFPGEEKFFEGNSDFEIKKSNIAVRNDRS